MTTSARAPWAKETASRGSFLGIEHLSPDAITSLLKLAKHMEPRRARPILRGRIVALLFYETSTRTRISFELAAKALGATTVLVAAESSSVSKGESLLDTVFTLRAAGADAIVIRHHSSGAALLAARHLDVPVVNAGDGMHEHPSQALLDAYTILQHKKSLRGLRVVIVGDILHSRVARSNMLLLAKLGAQTTLCGPPELAPDVCATIAPGVRVVRRMEEALHAADVIMMLRVQKERLAGLQLNLGEYISAYQLNAERLKMARPNALVIHPGPIIRQMEITGEVADGPQSVILEQVRNGVRMRMAILATSLGAAFPRKKP